MNPKKHLSFGSLIDALSKQFFRIEDSRQSAKIQYSIHDTMLSGFGCMFFQDRSLLEFQRKLEDKHHNNNLRSLLSVKKIPTDSQMRNIIDEVSPESYLCVFKEYVKRLQRSNWLKGYRFLDQYYICAVDATQYFSSKTVHCKQCLTTQLQDSKETIYSHKALQAAIVKKGISQVLPLLVEEIKNTDGVKKQDCEMNAGKRLLPKLKKYYPKLPLVITGDGLFSKQPFIELTLEQKLDYIYVAKPKDHKYLMDWVQTSETLGGDNNFGSYEIADTKEKNCFHCYKWMRNVPLHGGKESIDVNYFYYQKYKIVSDGTKKSMYQNSWVTSLEVNQENVIELVFAGRSRWKIENECFNNLKNQGYHLEHNYGHGKKHLCFNFYILTLLAFFFHQILELTDCLYQANRKKHGRLGHLWETLRSCIRWFVFSSWEELLRFTLKPSDFNISINSS